MNIHEYQAKQQLSSYGISVPNYLVVSSLQESEKALSKWGNKPVVVKAQVHAGGRGKAGGVRIAKDPQEAQVLVEKMLHMKIVNEQTGPQGAIAHKLMLSEALEIEKEYYLSLTIERKNAQAIALLSQEGGVDIEEIAKKDQKKLLKIPLTQDGRIRGYHLVKACKFMGWKNKLANQGKELLAALAKLFTESDASLVEINPLILDKQGKLVALDAKMSFDENALFRQPLIRDLFDPSQIPPSEVEAKKHGLSYIPLDGEIGCMVNGAGLAMATMDLIDHHGGRAANFLDVGGSASEEKVAEGFKIILADNNVRAILINIFGGIMDCATIASGVVCAVKEIGVKIPLILRMEGNNVERGKEMIQESGLNIVLASDLSDAAKKSVKAAY